MTALDMSAPRPTVADAGVCVGFVGGVAGLAANPMTTPLIAPLEIVQTHWTPNDETTHYVCHCTNDSISACRLDVTEAAWAEGDDEPPCPMCELAWPDDSPTCPWGCACEDCGG